MKNLNIGKKFLLSFGIIILLFIGTVVFSVVSLNAVGSNFTSFYDRAYQATQVSDEMLCAIQAASKCIGYATMSTDDGDTQEFINDAQTELNGLKEDVASLYEYFDGDKTLIDNVATIMTDSMDIKEQVLEYASGHNNVAAIDVFFNQYRPYLLDASDNLNKINDQAMVNADEMFRKSEEIQKMTGLLLYAVAAAVLIITVVIAVYLTRSLGRPIKEIEEIAGKVSEGQLDVSISYSSKDELGTLAGSVNNLVGTLKIIISDITQLLGEMSAGNFRIKTQCEEQYIGQYREILLAIRGINRNLSETLTQINEASDQVASGSGQVSDGAQELSQGATEQASAIEELSVSITAIADQIRSNTAEANSANLLTVQAGQALEGGRNKMQEMIQAMEGITATSGEISKIIKTIDDIAFQTNILALNAAVEAARAGEAGKGFAVVADEVRNLAQKSAVAAKDTTGLIESSIQAVGAGTKIADETAKAIDDVAVSASQVAEVIQKIANESEQQAQSIMQVTLGVDQISSVVQTNSATAEESAATSEELSGQAQVMKQLVERFTLRED